MEKLVVGIDIGGTNTNYGIFDKEGNCFVKNSFSTNEQDTFEFFLEKLYQEIEKSKKEIEDKYNIIGIGIGAPNGNYYSGTIEFAPNLNWKGVLHITKLLKKYYDIPIILTNDANAAANGEMIYGGAINMKNFIVITLGTGLGSGIVVNGNIVFGHNGFAGEIGHTIVDINGRICNCGKKGCLETYASATGIKRTVLELINTNNTPSILRDKKSNNISAIDIEIAAKNGDKIALEAFEYTGKILGLKLSDTIAHTNPEAIFLHGGLSKAGDLIFKPTKKWMEYYLLSIYKNKVKLLPSQIENSNAAILGAASLIWSELDKSINQN